MSVQDGRNKLLGRGPVEDTKNVSLRDYRVVSERAGSYDDARVVIRNLDGLREYTLGD
jgi:hypothetical protein